MKRIIILIAIVVLVLLLINKNTEDYVIIPNESIRFRIIPNSNTLEDIYMKEKVKDSISDTIMSIEKTENIEETRKNIVSSIPMIKDNINTLFKNNNYNMGFNVNYGINYFPDKVYKGVKYNEGNYESMVIEIGEAKGDNYWCVLFPPLCMIDAEESDEVEYKFFIKELIDKFIK